MDDFKSQFLATIIERASSRLTKSEKMVSDYIISNFPVSVFHSASELGRNLNVSKATVGRLIRKLGFESFAEFQRDARAEIKFLTSSPSERWLQSNNREYQIEKLHLSEIQNIKKTLNELNQTQVSHLVRKMTEPNSKIFIMGERKNWPMAILLYSQLNWILPSVHLIASTGSFYPDYLLNINPKDLLVVFHFRRYPRVVDDFVSALHSRMKGKVMIALITDSSLSPISHLANFQLIAHTKSLTLFDSYTAVSTIINVILMGVIEQKPEIAAKRTEDIESIFELLKIYSKFPDMGELR